MELSKILNEGVSALRQRPASWSRELNRLRGFSEIILGENSGGCTSSNSIDLKTYNYNDKDFNSTEDKKDYLQSNKTIKKIVSNEQDLRNQNEMVSAGWVPSCNYYIENNKSVSNFQRKRLLFYHENLGDNEATRKRFKIPGEVEVYEESEASEGLIDEEMPDEGGLSEKNTLDECFDKSCSGIEKLPSTLETESEYEFESESLSSPSDSNDADDCNTSVSSTTYEVEKNEVFHRFGYDKLVSSFQQRKINNEIDDQSNKRKAIIKQRKDEQIFLSKLENEKANWVKPKELKKIGKYPPIYSSNRQELCETLNYFKSYHSGHYVSESRTLGYLLDGFPSPRDEFEDFGKVIISHGGGGSKTITLKKKLESQNQEGNDDELFNDRFGVEFIKSQERNNYRIKSLLNCLKFKIPVVLIAGSKYEKMRGIIEKINEGNESEVRYFVLGYYLVTHCWPEKERSRDSKQEFLTRFKFRFQWLLSQGEPWWINDIKELHSKDFRSNQLETATKTSILDYSQVLSPSGVYTPTASDDFEEDGSCKGLDSSSNNSFHFDDNLTSISNQESEAFYNFNHEYDGDLLIRPRFKTNFLNSLTNIDSSINLLRKKFILRAETFNDQVNEWKSFINILLLRSKSFYENSFDLINSFLETLKGNRHMFEFVARSIYNSSSLSEITKRWIDEAFHQNGFSQCEQVPSRSIKLYQPPKNINVFEENVINCSGSRKDSSSNNSKTCFSAPTLLEFVQASEFNNLNRSAFETLIEENGAKQVLDLANSKSPADNQIFNNQKKQSYCDVCVYCNSSSPKIYQNGWMCLNESCERFFDLSNSKSKSFTNGPRESLLYKEAEELVYISEFLMHQSEFEDGVILVPYQLQPPSLQFLSSQNVKLRLEEESKKGIYCSDCGRISSRIYWGCLRCNNKKCSFTVPLDLDHIYNKDELILLSLLRESRSKKTPTKISKSKKKIATIDEVDPRGILLKKQEYYDVHEETDNDDDTYEENVFKRVGKGYINNFEFKFYEFKDDQGIILHGKRISSRKNLDERNNSERYLKEKELICDDLIESKREEHDFLFEDYQKSLGPFDFKRNKLRVNKVSGMVAQQFTINCGENYKFCTEVETIEWEKSPRPVKESLRQIREFIKDLNDFNSRERLFKFVKGAKDRNYNYYNDDEYCGDFSDCEDFIDSERGYDDEQVEDCLLNFPNRFNEVLNCCYFPNTGMNFHSDNEVERIGVGPMIASLSLGSDALMKFKKKVKKEKEQIDGSNNNKPTYIADFDQQECSKKKKCNKPVLEILLRHGDILIQFGSNIQNNWLHSISADGFRIAATARLIDASLNGKLHEPHTKKKKKLN